MLLFVGFILFSLACALVVAVFVAKPESHLHANGHYIRMDPAQRPKPKGRLMSEPGDGPADDDDDDDDDSTPLVVQDDDESLVQIDVTRGSGEAGSMTDSDLWKLAEAIDAAHPGSMFAAALWRVLLENQRLKREWPAVLV